MIKRHVKGSKKCVQICLFFLLDAFLLSGGLNCLNLIGAANDNMFKENKILNLIHSCRVNKNFLQHLPYFFPERSFLKYVIQGVKLVPYSIDPQFSFLFYIPRSKEINDYFKEFFSILVFIQVPT